MNDKEKIICDEIIEDLSTYTRNKIWKWILEEDDCDYDVVVINLVCVLESVINYEEGSNEYSSERMEFYLDCMARLNDLFANINWDNT
ncbi:hypothetical protein LQE93_12065 [Clostridium sp. NSJ-145]|uniref:hypothetical protein n=1 Tax=Clostridium sp. NSJ-145 TaxID=2897777 RepID=UPI001E29CE59|nr:hypothetical protein [Clostridium sp. NSJ-145]MCD2502518.1 hypothetical protein [Clostridium sp. NSJ-145]